MEEFPLEFDNSTGGAGAAGVRGGAAKIKAETMESAKARLELTPDVKLRYERLAKDYWDMVEMGSGSVSKRATVEYANDLDTTKFCSGFPLSSSARKMYRSFESKPPTAEEVVAAVAKAAATAADKSSSAVKEEELEGVGTEPPDCADMFSDDYYRRTGWNLVNIARCEGSVLSHLKTNINGINVPWLYIGMLFSSFCWHNEDNYLYSINYSHFGEAKQWYGVPGVHAKNFERVTKNFLMESFKASPDLLHHMTTQISPSLLVSNGIPVSKIVQTPRTFVVTFPKAFHAGFSYGFNCGEAVNFATPDWLNEGTQADERYRSFGRSSVFSHQRLLFTLLQHNSAEVAAQRRAYFRKKEAFLSLLLEVRTCLTEDLAARPWLVSQGVRDISQYVRLPGNNFDEIDERSSNYDDLRSCCQCKHICLLTAVACECDKNKVSCIRHSLQACRCPKEKRYMLQWMSTEDMTKMLKQVERMIAAAEKGSGK
jgi:histone demethylase JARID1